MIKLNPALVGRDTKDFERGLRERMIGQDRAVRTMARIYQTWRAGLCPPDRPIANLLFLGPTGTGKTRLVEAVAEVLLGSPKSMVKIDCAEYQRDHEVAKLIGSPPGYVGHAIVPILSAEKLESLYTDDVRLAPVLFDEIEKGAPALWQLLLGIMDKATLTLGDNTQVDFTNSIIFLTSNLASREVKSLISGGIGFHEGLVVNGDELDEKIYRTSVEAASRHFSPEFMNRLDRTVVFHHLKPEHLQQIVDIELSKLQDRIMVQAAPNNQVFLFHCTQAAREFLIQEGTQTKFGARHLKRAVERFVTAPLANLLATRQILLGDEVTIDYDEQEQDLVFFNEPPPQAISLRLSNRRSRG